jgi:hypothetical protein
MRISLFMLVVLCCMLLFIYFISLVYCFEKTKFIAVPHVSNLLGQILAVKDVVEMVKSLYPQARVIVGT